MIIKDAEKTTLGKAIRKAPASIALILYTFVSVWFVGGLSVFHFYLISTNQTTYENFRYRYDRRDNPYNKGVVQNFMEVFFTRIPPSKNNFWARARRDQWLSSQSNSASYIGPNMSNSESNSASYISRNTGKSVGNFETDRKPVIWGAGAGDSSDLEAGSDYMPRRKDNSFASDALSGSASDLEAGLNSMPERIDRRLISNTLPYLARVMPSEILGERKSGHFPRSFSTGTGVGESHRHGGNFTRSFSTGIGVGKSNLREKDFGARKSSWHGRGSGSTTSGHR
ncbi:putative protein S-acyltransferase 7 isoform X2 [Iris pallida]|nr:putative protein S-acyltransferase 7 isoform X2 [Iris pallida]